MGAGRGVRATATTPTPVGGEVAERGGVRKSFGGGRVAGGGGGRVARREWLGGRLAGRGGGGRRGAGGL